MGIFTGQLPLPVVQPTSSNNQQRQCQSTPKGCLDEGEHKISLCFNGKLSRGTWVTRIRMSLLWILLEQRMMELSVTTGAIRRVKAPVKMSPPTNQHPVFYRGRCLCFWCQSWLLQINTADQTDMLLMLLVFVWYEGSTERMVRALFAPSAGVAATAGVFEIVPHVSLPGMIYYLWSSHS